MWLKSARLPGPGLADLSIVPTIPTTTMWTVTARFASPVPADATVRIWWKPFDSEQDWAAVDAGPEASGAGSYAATVFSDGAGALFAVEIVTAVGAWRYPDPMTETPHISLAP